MKKLFLIAATIFLAYLTSYYTTDAHLTRPIFDFEINIKKMLDTDDYTNYEDENNEETEETTEDESETEYAYQKAVKKIKTGDTDAAYEILIGCITANDTMSRAYFQLAVIYEIRKEKEKAIAFYTNAIDRNPEYTDALTNRGLIYFNNKIYKKAYDNFVIVSKLRPNDHGAMLNTGVASYYNNDIEKALKYYGRSIEINPEYVLALTNRSYIHLIQNNFADALLDCESALKIETENTIAIFNKAKALEGLGRNTDAVAAYTLFLKKTSNTNSGDAQFAKNKIKKLSE